MQQPVIFNYSFSINEKEKRLKQERKPQPRKKIISYIDTRYTDRSVTKDRGEMDKDIVF